MHQYHSTACFVPGGEAQVRGREAAGHAQAARALALRRGRRLGQRLRDPAAGEAQWLAGKDPACFRVHHVFARVVFVGARKAQIRVARRHSCVPRQPPNPPDTPLCLAALTPQAFNWESHKHQLYKQLVQRSKGIADAGFTAIWLPPPSDSVSPQARQTAAKGLSCGTVERKRPRGTSKRLGRLLGAHRAWQSAWQRRATCLTASSRLARTHSSCCSKC
jgi:hypothetical protein